MDWALDSEKFTHISLPTEQVVNKGFKNFLNYFNLVIICFECFYIPPNDTKDIILDLSEKGARLMWQYGGSGSVHNFYSTSEPFKSTLVESLIVTTPILVNGLNYTKINNSINSLTYLECFLCDYKNQESVTFEQVAELLQDYIIF